MAVITKVDTQNFKNYDYFESFFIGLASIGTFLNFWSLFFPTNGTVLIILFVCSLAILYFFENIRTSIKEVLWKLKEQKVFVLLTVLLISYFLFYSILKPAHFDTYLYHMSSIQWNEQYKVVPGLANMQERLGFNSSIFVLSAAFLYNSILGQYIFIINALSIAVFSIWLIKIVITKKNALAIFALIFFYFFLVEYVQFTSSPNSDLLPNIFIGFLLISLFLNGVIKNKILIYIVLPLFCITLKISSAPVVFISIYALYQLDKSILNFLKKITLYGSIFVLPWLIRNVILTGYLIYPLNELDLFSFDWKIPEEKVEMVKNLIYAWARDYSKDYFTVMNMSFSEWFGIWWPRQLGINQVFFVIATFAPLLASIYYFFNRKNFAQLIGLLIAFACFLFWLKAPDFRFSYAPILFLALFPILLLDPLFKYLSKAYKIILPLGIAIVFGLLVNDANVHYKDAFFQSEISERYIKPLDPSNYKINKRVKYKKKVYLSSSQKEFTFYGFFKDSPCFDQFPCAPRLDDFKMRGEDLDDGFMPE